MAAVTLAQKSIGSVVKINVNGTAWDFVVVQQGRPSAMFDESCNGTWLLMKNIYQSRQWNSSDVNDYANSTIHSYLNSNFLSLFDANIRNAVKQVKIPYRPGSGTGVDINSGANGLSCKVFLLAGYEMGWTNSDNPYFPPDGAKLAYFEAGAGTSANNKRIAYLNGSAADWWLRSPSTNHSAVAWFVYSNGVYRNYYYCSGTGGVRPALILPSSLFVLDNGYVRTNTFPTISDTNRDVGDKNTDFSISYSVDDVDSGDTLTVTESRDGAAVKTFTATRNQTNTIGVPVTALTLGAHTVSVTVTDGQGGTATRAWTFRRTNTPPTISGSDTSLGDKNLGFTYSYTVGDADNDTLTVTEQLGTETLRTLNNAPKGEPLSLAITAAKLYSLGLNSVNTLKITVSDGKGGVSYRCLTFRRTNSAPGISGQDVDCGLKAGGFAENYTITDIEGDNVVVTEKLDDKVIRTYQAALGQQAAIELSRENWLSLTNGSHQLRVEAVDGNFSTSVRVWGFSKKETVILFQFTAAEETDARATKILITPTWKTEGGVAKVEACNNAFDASPAWEDITPLVLINRVFHFTNTVKTAAKWGVDVRFTITKNEGYTGEVSVSGFGGAYE